MRSRPGPSSPSWKPRPSAAPRPRTANRFAETAARREPLRLSLAGEVERERSAGAGDLHAAAALLQRHERSLGIEPGEPEQALRLGIGQRLQQDAIHQAEDGRGRADADRQRHDGRAREERLLAQPAPGDPDVLRERLERREPPRLAALLLERVEAAEALLRRLTRFLRGQPTRSVLLGAPLEMEAQLLVEVLLQPAAEERRRLRPDRARAPIAAHRQAVSITRATLATMRAQ